MDAPATDASTKNKGGRKPVAGAIGYWPDRASAMSHFKKISHLGPATKSERRAEHCRRMGVKGRAVLAARRKEARQEAFIKSLGWPTHRANGPPVPEDGDFETVEDRIWRTMQAAGQSSDPGTDSFFT